MNKKNASETIAIKGLSKLERNARKFFRKILGPGKQKTNSFSV